jgi:VanZ family protein
MAMNLMRAIHRARRAILLCCIGAWLLAAVATHLPAPELSGIHVDDKLLHLVGYFVLGSLFWLSLAAYETRARRRVLVVLIVLALYAVLDETTQAFVRRTPDVGDWLANVTGTVVAAILWETVSRLLRPHPMPPVAKTDAGSGYEQYPW